MNWRLFFIIMFTIFLAELGDKTQLAVLTYTSTDPRNKWLIFLGGSIALVLSTFIAVVMGATASRFLNPFWLQIIAAIIFICLGFFLLFQSIKEREAYTVVNKDLQAALETDCGKCSRFWDYMVHFQEEHHQRLSANLIKNMEKHKMLSLQANKEKECIPQCLIKDIHDSFHTHDKGGKNEQEPGTKDSG